MSRVIRVLLADDQDLVRAGLRTILESEPGIQVVAEAADGAEAVARCLESRPDVVCMDMQMPGVDGLSATREIVAAGSSASILVLTTFARDDYLFESLQAGASGFLLKSTQAERLIEAVQILARGEALLDPDVTRRVLDRLRAGTSISATGPVPELTGRELEVLSHVANGASNSEIAAVLFLGEATVKTHVSHMLRKLGVRDRVGLVAWAYRQGIVKFD
ncbi:response regulator [Micromonospora chokoriensis]